jgi:uncharacterized glyoxalase superfamily protein PhnB
MTTKSVSAVRKLTPVLVVEEIEPSLRFWTERLGLEATVQVPHDDRLGFVILAGNGVELMYQSHASVRSDIPSFAEMGAGEATALFVEVADLDAVERAMTGAEVILPRRTTFYGMREIGVREPGGHVVIFAQPEPTA